MIKKQFKSFATLCLFAWLAVLGTQVDLSALAGRGDVEPVLQGQELTGVKVVITWQDETFFQNFIRVYINGSDVELLANQNVDAIEYMKKVLNDRPDAINGVHCLTGKNATEEGESSLRQFCIRNNLDLFQERARGGATIIENTSEELEHLSDESGGYTVDWLVRSMKRNSDRFE